MEAHLNDVSTAEHVPDDAVDELLTIRCQLGEPAAFGELVDRWHLALWKYARRLSESDESARDAVQDIWLRVLRAMPRLRDPARLRPWLFGIARRALMDRLRDRYAAADTVTVDPNIAVPDDENGDSEHLDLLREELDRLPIIEREVLVLFYLRELSERQLAEVLDIPVGTVKSRLHRARRLLRQLLLDRGLR